MSAIETGLLIAGGGCYLVASGLAWSRRRSSLALSLLLGAAVFAAAIAVRWLDVGQGPFLTMYEILVSSLFSLGLVFGLACALYPRVCVAGRVSTGVLLLMLLWLAFTDPTSTPLPATYANPWLWVHVVMGKLFLGTCLIASSLAASALLRLPEARGLEHGIDRLAWQSLVLAFLFHSGMLVAGAVWAQDAWGRYWAWDPLESWAFGTWLVMAFALHARSSLQLSATLERGLLVGVFALAFLTFFGVPFVSLAPHKGAV